jgi:microcystin-dependent protein
MSNPYVGEIRMFAGNFAPMGWAFCDGSMLSISENDTLFNLIGTTYGGDGQSYFNLPNLAGRVPVHIGSSPTTGTNYVVGEAAGAENVTLTTNQIPAHSHALVADDNTTTTNGTDPTNHLYGNTNPNTIYSTKTGALQRLYDSGVSGGSEPHSNQQPVLAVSFIIALFGIYPSPT